MALLTSYLTASDGERSLFSMSTKFIFVTGGVISGLGKGIVAASIGNRLVNRGYKVFPQKFDPYLNIDAGTLNPAEHGECFVTADGTETDLDLGHYERFLDIELNCDSSVMSGSIYQAVINKERSGHYLGKTVQVIPHVTDEVKNRLYEAAKKSRADILITEIGGTIGDIESPHFVEAARQVALERAGDAVFIHVAYLPYLASSNEIKTKPAQNSINDLRKLGIHPSLVLCRADSSIHKEHLRKIALFAGLPEETIIPLETADTVYAVPLILERYSVDKIILKRLALPVKRRLTNNWESLVRRIRRVRRKTVNIGLVGKYMSMSDTYYSVIEALKAACWQTGYNLNLSFIDSSKIEREGTGCLQRLDGICAPGGFGKRDTEGIINAIRYAREEGVPYLGLCLGMQLACVEYARNVLNLKGANSSEFGNTPHPVINVMSEQAKKLANSDYGGSMRLGNFECVIVPDTIAARLYGQKKLAERHRHRYEFSNDYREIFERSGDFVFSGLNEQLNLVEIIELKNHPFFIACQFHPEFRSRPLRPHPLFTGFIAAVIKRHKIGPQPQLPLITKTEKKPLSA